MHKMNRGVTTDVRHVWYDIVGNFMVFALCHAALYGLQLEDTVSLPRTGLIAAAFLCFCILLCKNFHLYDITTFFYPDRVVRRVTACFILSVALVISILFFAGGLQDNYWFYISYLLGSYIVFLIMSYAAYRRNKGESARLRTLFIGSCEGFEQLMGYIRKTNIGLHMVGYVKYERDTPGEAPDDRYLGYVEDGALEEILHSQMVDQVFLMQEKQRFQRLSQCLELCTALGLITHVVIPPLQRGCASYVSSIGTYPVLSYHVISLNNLQRAIKRLMDIAGSLVGILLSSPILLVAAIAIKLDSTGPVLFCQERVGRNGRGFKIYKLRTMCNDAEAKKRELEQQNEMKDGFMFKIQYDPRITRVGAFLRKTSIDELPQFFNVLRGDMSLVGTRPPTKSEVELYKTHHWKRLAIKPGITGMWQISGRSAITDFDQVVRLDTRYIENWSIWLDIKIILKTVVVLFARKGAY